MYRLSEIVKASDFECGFAGARPRFSLYLSLPMIYAIITNRFKNKKKKKKDFLFWSVTGRKTAGHKF
jgi:hypothetical protein